MKTKFIYNKDLDSLAVFTEGKTYASIEVGEEIIVDLNRKKKVVGVEILNPDKLFKIPKKVLGTISTARLTSTVRGGILWVYVFLKLQKLEKEIPIGIRVQ